MSQLILYDLPTKGPHRVSWSLNPWKTRAALNFKGIDYQTEWVEYPDVKPKWIEFGIKPNDPKDYFIAYTSPMVKFTNGDYVMDSDAIAKRLEKEYPTPSLHLDNPQLPKVFEHATNIVKKTRPIWMPLVPNILSDRSAAFFRETRKETFGISLEEMLRTEGQEVERWEHAKVDGMALGDMLRENEGPYFMGSTVSYADFVLAGVLHCLKRVDSDAYSQVVKLDPALEPHYKACGKWFERDDH